MENLILDDVLEHVRAALQRDDLSQAVAIIEALRAPDQAELFTELDDEHQAALLPRLDPADSADILSEIDEEEAAELVASMTTDAIIRIVDEMEPDEAADLLGDIEPEQAQAVLAGLEDPDEVRPLLLHADESAGGLMTSEFPVLLEEQSVGAALASLSSRLPEEEEPGAQRAYYIYVVDRKRHLRGVVSLVRLLAADPQKRVGDVMNPDVISVQAGTDQEECARVMARYGLLSLPVVDAGRVLLGIITIDDVVQVLEEEATEDIQRLGGAQPLERSYLESSVLTVARKRIGWLLLLFVTESLTGSVLRHFESELQTVVALAFFVPLLIGTGGNAGSQTTSTIIRALAVGDIDLGDALHALWHELRAALLLGLGMAVIAYVRALSWGSAPALAWTVSLSILTIVVWANALGSLLPLLAARLRIDPALVSGPVMSTLVDATGLFIYFTIAAVMMGL